MPNKFLLLTLALLISGCLAAPTREQIESADYGDPIDREKAIAAIKFHMSGQLKDPYSAVYRCGNISKGWMQGNTVIGGRFTAGYVINCTINARNSYGAYVGTKEFQFLFHNGGLMRQMTVNSDGSLTPGIGDF